MKKRITALLSCILLALLLSAPMTALAAAYPAGINESLPRAVDEGDLLTQAQAEALNERARELSEQYQFDIVIVTRMGLDGKTPMEFADDFFDYGGYGWREAATNDITTGSGMVLLVDMQERDILISTKGEGMNIFPDSRANRMVESITPQLGAGDYIGAFTRFLDETETRLQDYRGRDGTSEQTIPVPGKYPAGIDESLPRVVDDAMLLNEDESAMLEDQMRTLIWQYEMDIVIVTREGLDGKELMEYADDFFDYGGYGWRENSSDDIRTGSGILLLVEMEQSEIWISTKGRGQSVFGDSEIAGLTELITPELGEGLYYDAFLSFLGQAEWLLENNAGDDSYDYDYDYGTGANSGVFNMGIFVVILIIGLVIAWAAVSSMKKKHNTIRTAAAAHSYQQEFNLMQRQDIFLYSNTTRVKLPEDPPPGSGGHSSSSGSSHGGGGGSFGGGHSSSSGSSHGGGGGKF